MPRRKPSSAGAFLTMARAYADAANALMIADASPSPLSSSPIYFLYSHAAELAFKAFLTTNSIPFSRIKHHDLPKLHKQSGTLGLVAGAEIGKVVSSLHSENEHYGFRYYSLDAPLASTPPGSPTVTSVTLPSLPWVREAIVELLKAVEPHVPKNVAPGGGAKMILTFSKPVPKA